MISQTKTLTNHDRCINWLVKYIIENPDKELNYRDIMRVLSSQQEFFIRCYILDHRYMYGSFIKEAQSKVAQ